MEFHVQRLPLHFSLMCGFRHVTLSSGNNAHENFKDSELMFEKEIRNSHTHTPHIHVHACIHVHTCTHVFSLFLGHVWSFCDILWECNARLSEFQWNIVVYKVAKVSWMFENLGHLRAVSLNVPALLGCHLGSLSLITVPFSILSLTVSCGSVSCMGPCVHWGCPLVMPASLMGTPGLI